jgi:membrane-associated protein
MFGFDLFTLAQTAGYVGSFLIIFAESGLFFGFFLPGDSFLFTLGLLASQGYFSMWLLVPLLTVAAVVGDNVGYSFGKYTGAKLFTKEESLFFRPSHVERAQRFFKTHGAKAIILARFIPIVRTFTPILAGAAKMNYKKFATYNVVGGILWVAGITILGYFLGRVIPNIDTYLIPIILGIIFLSFIPVLQEVVYLKKFLKKK